MNEEENDSLDQNPLYCLAIYYNFANLLESNENWDLVENKLIIDASNSDYYDPLVAFWIVRDEEERRRASRNAKKRRRSSVRGDPMTSCWAK